jgi:hypothetical protein
MDDHLRSIKFESRKASPARATLALSRPLYVAELPARSRRPPLNLRLLAAAEAAIAWIGRSLGARERRRGRPVEWPAISASRTPSPESIESALNRLRRFSGSPGGVE